MTDPSAPTTPPSPRMAVDEPAALSRLPSDDGWLVSRYADVQAALSDHGLEVSEAPPSDEVGTMAWLRAAVSRFANGTVHDERRAQVVEELRALDMVSLRSAAFQRSSDLLGIAGQSGREIEVMSLLARRVPMATLAAALGFTAPERAAEAATAAAGPYLFPSDDPDVRRRADAAVGDLVLLLESTELAPVVAKISLLVQGCDATAGLIGVALMHGELVASAGDAWSTEALVSEAARHGPPLRSMRRVATSRMNVLGSAIAPGDVVLCSIEAANRDPTVFSEPDRFDPTRRQRPIMTFGYGIRPCPASAHALVLAIGVVSAVRERCSVTGPPTVEWEDSILRIPRAVNVVQRD